MFKKMLVILLSALVLHGQAQPTTYDQRQEGDLNVKVDLDNFVIVVARPSVSSSSSLDLLGSMSQLFSDISRRGSPSNIQAQRDQGTKNQESEGKSSPEESPKALDDVSVEPQEKKIEEKTIVVVQEGEKAAESLENIVRTLRSMKIKDGITKKDKDKSKYKFVAIESVEDPANLRLVGDAVENCGPGRVRGKSGICQQERN